MLDIYLDGGKPVTNERDLRSAMKRLVQMALSHGLDPAILIENDVERHELQHGFAYFANTKDVNPELYLGITLDDEGDVRKIFVANLPESVDVELQVYCAPDYLSETDRENVKRLLRVKRERG